MPNNFKITITAADKATATVRKVKDAISQFTRPLRQVKASVGALGRELGLEKMTGGLSKMARGAEHVAGKIGGVVSAVLAIGGAASVASIAALARQWAFAGAEVARTAAMLDIGTTKLQTLRGAAEAFGLEAADLTAGVKTLGSTFEDALYGRNQQALALMNRLGISVKKTANGSIDLAASLYDVADAVQRTKNVEAQGVIARTFGVEQLLPMLQKGSAGIKAYEAAVAKSGAVMSGPALKAAQAFQYQLAMAKLNITGLGNAIMGDLIPALSPMLKGLIDWSQQNRAVIASNVKEFVAGLVAGIKVLLGVLRGAGGIISATIGWKNAGLALTFVLAARLLPAIWSLVAPIVGLTARVMFLAVTGFPRLMVAVAAMLEAGGLPALARGFFAVGLAADAALGPIGLALAAATALVAALRYLDSRRDHRVSPEFGGRGRGRPGGKGDVAPHPRSPVNRAAAAQAMAFFQQQGWAKFMAAGIVGNFAYESGLNPNQVGDGGAAYGIGQWHKPRQDMFRKLFGHDIRKSTLAEQLRFAQYELTQGGEKGAGDRLARSNDAAQASDAIEYGYERPSDRAAAASRYDRQALAQGLAGAAVAAVAASKRVVPKVGEGQASPPPAGGAQTPATGAPAAAGGPASPAAVAAAGQAAAGVGAQHALTVKFENAPPGLKVAAKASGAAKPADVRVETSMDGVVPP